jgi:hypothetical protein
VSNRVSRRQAGRWAQQDQPQYQEPAPQYQPPPAAPAAGTGDMIEQLKQLGELKEAGVLTEAEFAQQKARILGS